MNLPLVWLREMDNAGIAIEYILILIFLVYFQHRLKHRIPYSDILLWFALFVLLSTISHMLNVYVFWSPAYYLSGIAQVSAAVVGLYAVSSIRPTLSHLLDLADEREIAEAVQCEADAKFKEAFDRAAIGMALIGLDDRWLKVNRSLCELVDYSAEELLTKTFRDITHPEDLEHDLEHIQQMLEGKRETFRIEKRFYRKNGRLVWVLLSVSLVRNSEGHPLYFIHQIQDITKRKTIEYGMIDLTARLYSEVDELNSQELSKRIEKILEEAEIFESLAVKTKINNVL